MSVCRADDSPWCSTGTCVDCDRATPRVPTTVAEKRAEIDRRVGAALADRAALQAECEHAFADKEYRGNTGYDYENYWIEFRCGDCGKFWQEDQK